MNITSAAINGSAYFVSLLGNHCSMLPRAEELPYEGTKLVYLSLLREYFHGHFNDFYYIRHVY